MRHRTGCVATAAPPYWGPFEQRLVPSGSGATWVPYAAFNRTSAAVAPSCVVEFVTRPNNPDGSPRSAHASIPGASQIHDLVYNWPAYGPVVLSSHDAPVDVAIFTASKILGHASSRLGWAFVRDETTARYMFEYIWANGRCSTDAQLRHVQTLGLILDSHRAGTGSMLRKDSATRAEFAPTPAEMPFMEWMRAQLVARWERLAPAIVSTGRLALASYGWTADGRPESDASSPRHMFMWLRTRDGSDCEEYLRSLRIKSHPGSVFGAPSYFCRLAVGIDRSSFELMAERFERAIASPALESNTSLIVNGESSGGPQRRRRLGRFAKRWTRSDLGYREV